MFKALANDTRLRLLHALARQGELCMTDLAKAVGMKPQAVSNQLQRLAAQGILGCRRERSQAFYRLVDPCVVELLDRALCLTEDAASRKR
jgi:ArsR family transcriptional regulator, lead/cadmium/zinc/bismuth-responsive transcriptional repressor